MIGDLIVMYLALSSAAGACAAGAAATGAGADATGAAAGIACAVGFFAFSYLGS